MLGSIDLPRRAADQGSRALPLPRAWTVRAVFAHQLVVGSDFADDPVARLFPRDHGG